MAKNFRLPFKGDFHHIQTFGARPDRYKKFGLRGHDGNDFEMPVGTKLFASVDGIVRRVAFDSRGWGRYLQIHGEKENLLVNLAHLASTNVHEGDVVKAGDEVARSGNSGNSSTPHLHIAAADTGDDGKKLNVDNGYKGWYSILDKKRINLLKSGAPEPEKNNDKKSKKVDDYVWSIVYRNYYIGWEQNSARVNFKNEFKDNVGKLREARGLKDIPRKMWKEKLIAKLERLLHRLRR